MLSLFRIGIFPSSCFLRCRLNSLSCLLHVTSRKQSADNYPSAFRYSCEHIYFGASNSFRVTLGQSPNRHCCLDSGRIFKYHLVDVYAVFPFVLIGIVLAYFFTKDLNMLSMGDDTAQHLGVNTERVRQILLLISSLITGAVVSISGVIGFVGLIIPHMTRLVIGPDHRILLPTSAIVGAIFLILCDSLARVATGASELPVGVITALAGTPFFIYLLRKRKTSYSL